MNTFSLNGFTPPTPNKTIAFGVTPKEELTLAIRLAEKSATIIAAERKFLGSSTIEELAREEMLMLRTIIEENRENLTLQAALVKARQALSALKNTLGIKEFDIPGN